MFQGSGGKFCPWHRAGWGLDLCLSLKQLSLLPLSLSSWCSQLPKSLWSGILVCLEPPGAAVSWVCLPFLWFAAPQAGTGGCRSSLCLLHPCYPNPWILWWNVREIVALCDLSLPRQSNSSVRWIRFGAGQAEGLLCSINPSQWKFGAVEHSQCRSKIPNSPYIWNVQFKQSLCSQSKEMTKEKLCSPCSGPTEAAGA